MSESIIQINGMEATLPLPASLADVLRKEGIDPEEARGVAVAVNERIVRRHDWAEKRIDTGDAIEIVTARQGG